MPKSNWNITQRRGSEKKGKKRKKKEIESVGCVLQKLYKTLNILYIPNNTFQLFEHCMMHLGKNIKS